MLDSSICHYSRFEPLRRVNRSAISTINYRRSSLAELLLSHHSIGCIECKIRLFSENLSSQYRLLSNECAPVVFLSYLILMIFPCLKMCITKAQGRHSTLRVVFPFFRCVSQFSLFTPSRKISFSHRNETRLDDEEKKSSSGISIISHECLHSIYHFSLWRNVKHSFFSLCFWQISLSLFLVCET